MTTTMTTRPALDRLADRASIREFAALLDAQIAGALR